jgi:hypothetical protein
LVLFISFHFLEEREMRKLILLCVLAALLLAPAVFAVEKTVNFYGSARVATFVESKDSEYLHNTGDSWSDSDTTWDKEDWTSRFGANFSMGNVTGNVEIRPNDGGYVRHWYGAWDFGGGTLVVGRTWAPTFVGLTSSNLAGNYWGPGDIVGSLREDGLQVWIPVGNGTLKIAALAPALSTHDNTDVYDPYSYLTVYSDETDTTLPKLEVSFDTKINNFAFGFVGGYNSIDVQLHSEGVGYHDLTASIDSWLLGGWFNLDLKPAYLKGGIYVGQNLANYGSNDLMFNPALPEIDMSDENTLRVNDASFLSYGLVLGFAANDKLTLEGWYWHVQSDRNCTHNDDHWKFTSEASVYGVMAMWQVAPNVSICPEIARIDCGDEIWTWNGEVDETTPMGTSTIYGIYWQIDF